MKKTIPIAFRNYLDDLVKGNPNLIRPVFEDKFVVVLREKHDANSPFYFRLEEINTDQHGKTSFIVEFVPSNYENLKPVRYAATFEMLKENVKTWINLLIEYNKDSLVFDDPITQRYYEDLEPQFTIIDKDADFAPHSFEQQEQLQKFLDFARQKVEAHTTPENKIEAEEIIKEIAEAKDVISKSTKSENTNKIRKIISRIYKINYDVGKELLIEFLTDAAKWIGSAAAGALLG
jgi:uncharacterized protein (UPF0332 family)